MSATATAALSSSLIGSAGPTLYCLCQRPYNPDSTEFMIECEACKDWFHGSCVGIQEHQASEIETYHCPGCQPQFGPLLLKKRRSLQRPDYSESDDNFSKAIKTGTVSFLNELKSRNFASMDNMPLTRLSGYELTKDYIERYGFSNAILVDKKDGLDIKVPPQNFSIRDIENCVGSMREIDVIDVEKQEDFKMVMREWTEYYNSPDRPKILNVISLEFSNTRLADYVEPPRIVRELSWVNNYWPKDSLCSADGLTKPEVHRYCLMGVKDSFTDFHIDFGGTSVWYHVLRGEKVFYMIEPTQTNLSLYEHWLSASNQNKMFFGDQVDVCYKFVIRQGQTVFIPTGWIHAVLTPVDSVVFGGNFLSNFNIELQLKIYEIERRVSTPEKYLFPFYEALHWFTAQRILDTFKDYRFRSAMLPQYLVKGAVALFAALKTWAAKKDAVRHLPIPESVQHGQLLKDLQQELKYLNPKEKPSPNLHTKSLSVSTDIKVPSPRKRKKKSKLTVSNDTPGSIVTVPSTIHQVTGWTDGLGVVPPRNPDPLLFINEVQSPPPKKRRPKKQKNVAQTYVLSTQQSRDGVPKLNLKLKRDQDSHRVLSDSNVQSMFLNESMQSMPIDSNSSVAFQQDHQYKESLSADWLKSKDRLPIPHAGLDSPSYTHHHLANGDGPGAVSWSQSSSLGANSLSSMAGASIGGGIRLRMTGGKILSSSSSDLEAMDPQLPMSHYLPDDPQLQQQQSNMHIFGSRESSQRYLEQVGGNPPPIASTSSVPYQPPPHSDDSEDGAHLVVDETAGRHRTTIKPASLKQNLPVNRYARNNFNDNVSSPASGTALSGMKLSQTDDYVNRLTMPIIRGGLNSSIADILEVSGYGTETDIKVDDDIGTIGCTSPTMRDAIQGMLSMSRQGGMSISSSSSFSHLSPANRTGRLLVQSQSPRMIASDDIELQMANCYKDDDFVYPTLDISDSEEDFRKKPRTKVRNDESWNPKGARSLPSVPTAIRQSRPAARKESVASGLAAAAAKLSNLPPKQKKSSAKKKPKVSTIVAPVLSVDSHHLQHPANLNTAFGSIASAVPSFMSVQSVPKKPAIKENNQVVAAAQSVTKKPIDNQTKKHKKGEATAKQRLSKKLKMHKMLF